MFLTDYREHFVWDAPLSSVVINVFLGGGSMSRKYVEFHVLLISNNNLFAINRSKQTRG